MVKINLRIASRAKQYITRGHASIGLGLSVVNSCVIWFGLIPFVNSTFGKLRNFILIFIPAYIIFTLAFGYWDMKKGMYRHELAAAAEWSPVYQDIFFCFKRIGENVGDKEICKVADRWISRRQLDTKQPYTTEEENERTDQEDQQ